MSDLDKCEISSTSVRYASWTLEIHIKKKRKLLQGLLTENDPNFDTDIADLKEDIGIVRICLFKEIRKALNA